MPEDLGKHIEDLGKEAAENYVSGIIAPDWSIIERKLDIEMPVEKEKRRRLIFFWFILGTVLVSAGIFLALNNNEPQGEIVKTTTTQKSNATTEAKKTIISTEANKSNTIEKSTATTESAGSIITNNEKQIKQEAGISVQQKPIVNSAPIYNNTTKPSLLKKKEEDTSNNSEVKSTEEKTNKELAVTKDVQPPAAAANKAINSLINPAQEEHIAFIGSIIYPVQKQADVLATPANTTAKEKPKKEKGFEFGFSYGLDMSSVKLKHNAPPSHSIGITAAYNFSSKLSLRSGLLYTQKNYKARGEDYTYKSWYYVPPTVYSTKLLEAEGYCNMFEIPLSIRYTLNPSARLVFFASAGASTYLMKKESYDYLIQYNNWAPQQKSRTIKEASNYFFGIADLSVGVRTKLSSKLFFEIQPFAKIPLRGVGNGNILLSSFGSYGNLVYKLPYRNKK